MRLLKSLPLVLCLAAVSANAQVAPSVSIGTVQGAAGSVVHLSVPLVSAGAQVSALGFDITYDNTNLTFTSVVAGSSANAAGKGVSTSNLASGTVKRVIIAGLNNNTIADGDVTDLTITIAAGAPAGTYTLALSNLNASDPNGNSLTLTGTSGSVVVPAQSQTITFGALSNATFGVAPITLSATASSGLTVSFASTTQSVCTVSTTTLTVIGAGTCSIDASQAGNGTYAAATDVIRSFTVATAAQTISFGALSNQALGGAPVTVSATASSGLLVAFSSTTTAVCTVSGSAVTLLTTGTCTITASQPGNANFNAASPVSQSFTVTPATQTITFGALSGVTFGVAPFGITATASSGLTVAFASTTTSVCTVSGSTVTIVGAGTCSITASQAGNANNNAAAPVTQSFTVSQATQTITFGALSAVAVGVAPFGLTATSSSGLAVSYASTTSSVCTVSGSTVTIAGVGTCSITASQAGNTNFSAATSVNQSFTVNQGSQTITFAQPANQVFGTGTLNLTATASSGLAVSFASTTTSVCTVSGAAVTFVTPGSCSITASQAGNANYTAASPVTQSFTISPAGQTITFGPLSNVTFGAAPFGITATASSGLTVTFASNTTAVCTVSGSTVTIVGAGTCSITASQAGNANFGAGTPVTQSFTVSLSAQTITFSALSGVTFGASPFTVSATASSGLAVSFASTTTAVCTVSGSTVTIVAAGTCTITASQAGNANFTAAANVSQSFTVSPASQTISFGAIEGRVFGGAPLTVTATASSGLTVSFTSTTTANCTVSAGAVTFVNVGTCSITASQAGNANYSAATPVSQSFTISQGSQTITFGPLNNGVAGGTPPALTATASSGLAVSYTASPSGVCTVSGTTIALVGIGTCSITASQPGNANYAAAANVTQTFTVGQGPQTINFPTILGGALGATISLNASATSGLPVSYVSNTLSVCTVSQATATMLTIGSCSITASQAGNASYTAAQSVTQTFPVASAITIQTSSLPVATQSASYSAGLSASGGVGSLQWFIASGALPSGLSFNGNGSISGTPAAAGSFSFTVSVSDSSGGKASRSFTIQVNPPLVISTSSVPNASSGSAYSATFSATGGAGGYTWAVTSGSLPAGISLSANGALTGTSTAAGSFSFSVTVTDSAGSKATQAVAMQVIAGLTITTTSLPPAAQGTSYSQVLAAAGGSGTIRWSITSGSLPAGLSLTTNGVLSGVPQTSGSATFTVQAVDQANAVATQSLTLTINAVLTITTTSLPDAVQGVSYAQTLAATGGSGTLSWSILAGALPGGVTLSSAGGLSGTPTSAGSFSFTAQVTDGTGSHAQAPLSLRVNAPLSITTTSLSNAVIGSAYSQTLTATGGSGTDTWSVTTGTLPGGITLSAAGALAGTPSATGTFTFTVQVADQAANTRTLQFSLQVNGVISITTSATLPSGVTGLAYSVTLAATGGTGGPYKWSVTAGTLPAGLAVSAAGVLSGNPSVAGPFSFTIQAADGVSTPATLVFSATVFNVLSITTSSLPNGVVGQPYAPVTLAATGGSGTVTWAATGLPANLSLSGSGTISGIPSAAGNASVAITATDTVSAQTAKVTLGLTIAAGGVFTISPSSLVLGAGVGGSVSGAFTATGASGSVTWSVSSGSLPSGVVLNSATGAVSGSVSQAGNSTVTVGATDGKSTAAAQLTINVLGLTSGIPGGAATVPYSTKISAIGGTPPYAFSATGLPAGLSMGGGGALSGTLASAGTFSFTVQVNDSQGLSVSAGYSLTIRTAPVSVKTPVLPDGTVGTPYSQVLTATGGNPPYTWSTVGGTLPTGLSLTPSGTIFGTPTTPGTSVFAVQATDSAGGIASAQATLVIDPVPLTVTTTSLPSGVLGFDYPQQILGASGGTAPYVFSITGGGLPGGISLAGGVISGSPKTSGDFPITLTVKDSAALTASASLTLSIRGNVSDLLLSGSSASFSLASGTNVLPSAQTISVQSTVATQAVTYTSAVAPASPWLSVGTGSQTPSTLSIGLTSQALTLAPGTYSATIALTCTSASCAGKTQSVAASLQVSAPPPQLSVTSSLLSFSSNSTLPQAQSQPLGIQNVGGGTITVNSITCEASWCSVSGVPASLAAGFSTQVTVTVDPTQLGTGFFRTAVDVATSAGNVNVPVNFFVSQTVSMTLSPSGSQFGMQQGGAPGNPAGSFLLSLSGASTNWTAAVLPGANWLTLNSPSGTATSSQPGTVSFSINSNAAGLTSQAYYGTIRITASGVVNSPQDYQVILNVVQPTTSIQPDPEPGGLLFVASGTAPAGQLVTVYSPSTTPVGYQTAANSTGGWLSVTPAVGSTSTTSPGQSTVTVNTAGLAAGVYTGGISYSSTGAAVRTVNVTLVIAGAAGSSRTAAQGGCSAASLVAAPTGLVSNFSAPSSWPTPLVISLADNCGQSVTDGQVTATFSNGDPPLALPLVNASKGLYSATWTPRKSASQVVVQTRATSGSGLASATAQIAGAVAPNAAPTINPQATVQAFNPQVGAPLAPGTIMAIYGANLASQPGQPTSIPLATTFNGTSVIIGGIPSPLFYVSPGQINVQVPYELAPNKQYQVVVSANGAIATPQTINLAANQPGIAAFGDGTVIAQHQDGSLVSQSAPAVQGEYLVMYLLGLGDTDNAVPSGSGSPGNVLARPTVPPVLTLGGTPIPIAFAGLTPGLVGLYQINVQVPQNTPGGNQALVVSQNGTASNATILPVQLQ